MVQFTGDLCQQIFEDDKFRTNIHENENLWEPFLPEVLFYSNFESRVLQNIGIMKQN